MAIFPPSPPSTSQDTLVTFKTSTAIHTLTVSQVDHLRALTASAALESRRSYNMSLGAPSTCLASSSVDGLGSPCDPLLGRVLKLFSMRRSLGGEGPAGADFTEEIGLMVLLGGSKSAKLDRAFRIMSYEIGITTNNPNDDDYEDDDIDDLKLPPAGLKVMLEAFLTTIVACVETSSQLEVEEASKLVGDVASHAVALIGEYLGEPESSVSFNDFGSWYNDGGFKDCPWLELLDLRKWTAMDEDAPAGLPPPPPQAKKAGGGDGDDVVVSFDFPTSAENPAPLSISITKADLRVLSSAVTESTLMELAPQEIIGVLKELCSSEGKLSYSVIARLAHSLYPTAHPADRRRDLILTHFSLLDPTESGVLPFEDVAAGFTLFCGGNKSEKLAAAFDLFKFPPSSESGGLGKRALWRFLRSFLSALVSVSMVTNNRDPEEMYDPVDQSAVWTASLIFDYVAKSGAQAAAGEVDFEEFADWYTTGSGFKAAPWLELLDLKKLLGLQYDGSDAGADDAGGDGGDYEEEGHGEEDVAYAPLPDDEDDDEGESYKNTSISDLMSSGVLFSFPLAPSNTGSDEAASTLYLTKHDVEYVRILVSETLLRDHEPDDVFGFFSEQIAWSDTIDRASFSACLDDFVFSRSGKRLDGEVLNIFDTFFSCFELGGDVANLAEIMSGLSLFCKGEKSSKLAFGFELFDSSSASSLSDEQLYRFLRSLLAMIFSCTAQGLSMSTSEMKRMVRSTSIALTSMVMAKMHEKGLQRVSFDDFGDWYNEGGYEACPWLELLALRKWTSGVDYDDDDHDDDDEYEGEEDEEENYDGEEDGGEGDYDDDDENDDAQASDPDSLTFGVHLPGPHQEGPTLVSFNKDDVAKVTELVVRTGLANMDFREVCNLFITTSESNGGYITKSQFDSCIRSLIPGSRMTDKEERQRISSTLSGFFYAFDRERSESVDAVELAAGFCMLCAGSKSDKLAYAFEVVDEDLDGKLSRRATWRFARSFLTLLIKISSATTEAMEEDEFFQFVDSASVWTAAAVFQRGKAKFIKFDNFADWYTEGGYEYASWLELLDLRKWCVQE
mmetsp:Transcript_13788/g.28223  ORF Transcript_13788/g.28223 Transcript_13788/m.28223 type:complete len:1069 (-) Transcript_13788:18-3224(-)